MSKLLLSKQFDPLPDVQTIVEDSVKDGLVEGLTLTQYRQEISQLTGYALEDYLQDLWDRVGHDAD